MTSYDEATVSRFWSKVDKSSDCWLWTAGRSRQYGTFALPESRRLVGAHRFAYELSHGAIPDGLCVMHVCDVPSCVNPAHLTVGTQGDNVRDMFAKRRSWQSKKAACPSGHPYDEANTHVSAGRRFCRECNRLATVRRRSK